MGLSILSFSKLTVELVGIRARVINFGFHGKICRKVPIRKFNPNIEIRIQIRTEENIGRREQGHAGHVPGEKSSITEGSFSKIMQIVFEL